MLAAPDPARAIPMLQVISGRPVIVGALGDGRL